MLDAVYAFLNATACSVMEQPAFLNAGGMHYGVTAVAQGVRLCEDSNGRLLLGSAMTAIINSAIKADSFRHPVQTCRHSSTLG